MRFKGEFRPSTISQAARRARRWLVMTSVTLIGILAIGNNHAAIATQTVARVGSGNVQSQPATGTAQTVKFVLRQWGAEDSSSTTGIAWGDVDGDGDLDLATNAHVYLNEAGKLQTTAAWTPTDYVSGSVAWGDVDGDGDLDLAVGAHVYLNEVGKLQTISVWSPTDYVSGRGSVAWGDVDGDGDFDLAIDAHVYLNEAGKLQTTAVWTPTDGAVGIGVAWGDVDGDGDLDLAVDAHVYLNEAGKLQTTAVWTPTDGAVGIGVAWGDVDGDGDLDLARGGSLYLNQHGHLQTTAAWTAFVDMGSVTSLAWGDVDGDGNLDLIVANDNGGSFLPGFTAVYLNEQGTLQGSPAWTVVTDNAYTSSMAWGDVDGDGDLDLVTGGSFTLFYLNEPSKLQTTPTWPAIREARSVINVAWGDVDGDSDLDLAIASNLYASIYLNEHGTLQSVPAWWGAGDGLISSIAWGDVDGDGDLDLAIGGGFLKVYLNEQGTLQITPAWTATDNAYTSSMAWGDVDGDGDLDLATGGTDSNFEVGFIKIYLNEQGTLQTTPTWTATDMGDIPGMAWGDVDGDGDLDLATAGAFTKVYLNEHGSLQTSLAWTATDSGASSLAWGDVDGDGYLDLATGGLFPKVYLNEQGTLQGSAAWTVVADNPYISSLAWGDVDGDGDLDLATGGLFPKVYLNEHGALETTPTWTATDIGASDYATSVAWGDVDGDGDLDLAIGTKDYFRGGFDEIYLNLRPAHPTVTRQPNSQFAITLQFKSDPIPTFNEQSSTTLANANFYAAAGIRQSGLIPITYNLFHPTSEPIGAVRAYYTLDGSFSADRAQWRIAKPALATQLADLTSSPYPTVTVTNTHVFNWDVFNSGFFGQSDNVVVRIEALPNLKPVRNGVPGPSQRPFISAQTFPFRVRSNQIRVVKATNPSTAAENALVYRLPAQQTGSATPDTALSGRPNQTDAQGYLQGHGNLGIGDRLIALWPVTATSTYTLYQTSAAVTNDGLDSFTVTQSGVQTLTTSLDHPLILFNLVVSLEWDALNDATFMAQLEKDLRRVSQILYDLTNGQAALGKICIYQDKEFWGEANLVIRANNSQRPGAIMGGIVSTSTADVDVYGQALPDAYVPGQVRIGPTWNRFGNPDGTLGEDWPRALAHELGHYLFFQADDYIGVTPDGQLSLIECAGSTMAEPYENSDSEFLTRSQWTGDCLNTVANRYLGRADWESITRFYPMMNGITINPGPSQLPLAVTEIETFPPVTSTNVLAAPFFHLVDGNNNTVSVAEERGQAYLIKTHGNSTPTDDYIIAEGTPIGDLVQARGAAPGDRLCVFDYNHSPLRLGCNVVGSTPGAVMLQEIPNWTPQLQVTAITSNTLIVTVTNVADTNLNVQLLPALGVASAEVPMTRVGANFVQTVTATDGAFYGFIRIWVPGSNLPKEIISEYTAVEAWHGRSYAWGGRSYAWGGRSYAWGGRSYAWGAPVMSSDGQVSIFPLHNLFGNDVDYTLQTVAFPPHLPVWLTPVGQVYQINSHEPLDNSAILFRYLARDVPAGYEDGLRIYYSPDEGAIWQRIPTQLDTHSNQASGAMQGEGIYVLVATTEVRPALTAGWNAFGYPVQGARPVANALASIAGSYNIAYSYNATTQRWELFAPTVPAPFSDLVNTLHQLDYTHSYWVYATQPVTLYLGVGNPSSEVVSSHTEGAATVGSPPSPATYYGWITPSAGFTPAVGMRVGATMDDVVCGETTIQELDGKLAYVLQVPASDPSAPSASCGASNKDIVFSVDQWIMDHNHAWDNSQAWFQPLTTVKQAGTALPKAVYLPYIQK